LEKGSTFSLLVNGAEGETGMFPIRKILYPTDFSDCSFEALKIATEIASKEGAELYLLHVLPEMPHRVLDPDLMKAREEFEPGLSEYEEEMVRRAQQKLHEVIAQRVPKDLKAHALVTKGDAAGEIARIAEDERAGLIVMSTHGMKGWRQVELGSVAERVVRSSSRPVLTIRAPRIM
jgi:nucleotide-binding universal stress UspA family protein